MSKTSVTTNNFIVKIHLYTVKQLARMTNLSLASVHGILKTNLKLREMNTTWIPHLLSNEQKIVLVEGAKK